MCPRHNASQGYSWAAAAHALSIDQSCASAHNLALSVTQHACVALAERTAVARFHSQVGQDETKTFAKFWVCAGMSFEFVMKREAGKILHGVGCHYEPFCISLEFFWHPQVAN